MRKTTSRLRVARMTIFKDTFRWKASITIRKKEGSGKKTCTWPRKEYGYLADTDLICIPPQGFLCHKTSFVRNT